MKLRCLSQDFTICQIDNAEKVDFSRDFVFVSRTPDEISLVCETACVPEGATAREDGWRAFVVDGVLDFDMVGVIAKISHVLAKAEISLFVVSTYNTDYVLLKADDFELGIEVLVQNGYKVHGDLIF